MARHTARPSRVNVHINGTYVQLGPGAALLLTLFENDEFHDFPRDPNSMATLVRRGWVQRARGHYRLTPTGREAHAVITAYYERRKTALSGESD